MRKVRDLIPSCTHPFSHITDATRPSSPEPNKCNYLDPGEKLVQARLQQLLFDRTQNTNTHPQYLYVLAIYYSIAHFLIKSTFLAFYLRLSPNREFRLWIGVGFGLNIGSLLINLLIIIFQCIPVSASLHTFARLQAQCMNRDFVLIGPAVVVRLPLINFNPIFSKQ